MTASCQRDRRGFTLLELMAVMIVIGLLAAIGISKFGGTKKRALIAAMKSDLHTIAINAESRFIEAGTYDGLLLPPASAGVTIAFEGTPVGFVAIARNAAIPETECTLRQSDGPTAQVQCTDR